MSDSLSPSYVAVAISSELDRVASAGPGVRNLALNRAAFSLGQLVAAGALSDADVRAALEVASAQNGLTKADGINSVRKTIASGLGAGKRTPRAAPAAANGHRPAWSIPSKALAAALRRPLARAEDDVPTFPLIPERTPPDKDGKPLFILAQESGPPIRSYESRRHVYRREGVPVRVKLKFSSGGFVNWYRVQDGKDLGWQAGKPEHYMAVPYFPAGSDPFDSDLRGDRVYWPEGERDVDTLVRLGIPAFTFGGTGDGLPAGIERYLAHKRIVILADNDESGLDHARKKFELCLEFAAWAKIVRFPELLLGGDVSDWIAAGGTVEQLEAR